MCTEPREALEEQIGRNENAVTHDVAYPMIDRTKGQRPARAEDMRLDPEKSCLEQ